MCLFYKKNSGRSGIRTQDRPVMSRLLWPSEVNLSVINCRTFRRTSKQYQNLICCKQTQNEREGHSRKYPHRPVQIWACHTQTVEVHMNRFHYAASREPELSFFRIALPATVFRYQSLQRAGERTSLLLGIYNMLKNSPTESFFKKFFIFFSFTFRLAYARQIIQISAFSQQTQSSAASLYAGYSFPLGEQ